MNQTTTNKNKYYIGIGNTYHDPAIAILNGEGEVLFAEATERYLQNKRSIGAIPVDPVRPLKLIREYLSNADEITFATSWSKSYVRRTRRNAYLLRFKPMQRLLDRLVGEVPYSMMSVQNRIWGVNLQNALFSADTENFRRSLLSELPGIELNRKYFKHHRVHASIGSYGSPYEEAAALVVDGQGENGAVSLFHYKNNSLSLVHRQKGGGSLGFMYDTLTHLCGFVPMQGEQWKVMGLAPYGKLVPDLYALLDEMMTVEGIGFKSLPHRSFRAKYVEMYKRFKVGAPNSPSAEDVAFTGQRFFEEKMLGLVQEAAKKGISPNLVLGGGCALNSACNGKIVDRTDFESVFVPSAPGDDGNALGAALCAYYEDFPAKQSRHRNLSPYLGSEMKTETIDNMVRLGGLPKVRHLPETIHAETARLLAEGKLVGWIQGKAEFGPRALGNRSILADPRRPEMKDKINALVKFREGFRPFAPSVLHEFGPEIFESYQTSPYMERTLTFKEGWRDRIPAVVHANSTGRLQSVKEEWNPDYHRLIKSFYDLTEVPVVLNTSFNVMGKPIIHSLEDAISVFYTTGLEALVVQDYLIEK